MEMSFLPDVYVECEDCGGARFTEETLAVHLRRQEHRRRAGDDGGGSGRVLRRRCPPSPRRCACSTDIGLGYLTLGQGSNTLSGGEAQRIKLAYELGKESRGATLYVLDEPTTGLHFADIERLIDVLHRLVDRGNTVVTIEHNLDIIKEADWIIDLGPEGGDAGGEVVAMGPPDEILGARPLAHGALPARLPERQRQVARRVVNSGRSHGAAPAMTTICPARTRSGSRPARAPAAGCRSRSAPACGPARVRLAAVQSLTNRQRSAEAAVLRARVSLRT